jgi:hypothetical protein
MGSREEGPAQKSEQEPGSAAHSSSPGLARVSRQRHAFSRQKGHRCVVRAGIRHAVARGPTIPQTHAESMDTCGSSA